MEVDKKVDKEEQKYGDKVYTLKGIPMMHVREVSESLGLSKQWLRRLMLDGNVIRKMKFYRDRSRLMIPIAELEGFPFLDKGKPTIGVQIYHYVFKNGEWVREICKTCSYTEELCEARKKAEALVVPEGDK